VKLADKIGVMIFSVLLFAGAVSPWLRPGRAVTASPLKVSNTYTVGDGHGHLVRKKR